MVLSIVVAISENHIIGNDNALAWHLPKDLQFFKNTTTGAPIIMGRKTYDSIGRPLPNRTNIIVSRNTDLKIENCICIQSIEEAIKYAQKLQAKECFIIGGAEIFMQTFSKVDRIFLTEIKANVEGNIKLDLDLNLWKEISRTPNFKDEKHAFDFDFVVYEKK